MNDVMLEERPAAAPLTVTLSPAQQMSKTLLGAVWTLEEALPLLQELERKLAPQGTHVCLGGSVLYQGWSGNDLDIYFYPHHNLTPQQSWDTQKVLEAVSALGMPWPNFLGLYGQNTRQIFETSHLGRKVNLFFFKM